MSTYRKEKNLVYFTIEGASGEYVLDINTGIFYGVKGKPIKNLPKKTSIINSLYYETSVLAWAIRYALDRNTLTDFARYATELLTADRLDSLGVVIRFNSMSLLNFISKHFAEVMAYCKEHDTKEIGSDFEQWVLGKQFEKKFAKYITPTVTEGMIQWIAREFNDATDEEVATCLYYLDRQKMWEFNENGHFVLGSLRRYIDLCRMMKISHRRENNFFRVFVETKREYQLRKVDFDNEAIRRNYAKHQKSWQFEHNGFTIVVPTKGRDLIEEGHNMHHCVGSYVNNIVDNSCYIIFIRRTNAIDDCYITCQVYTDGTIGQYYLAYDRHIHTAEDFEFKQALQQHLLATWDM